MGLPPPHDAALSSGFSAQCPEPASPTHPPLSWLPAPVLSRSGPNCSKSLCQACPHRPPTCNVFLSLPVSFPELPLLGAVSRACLPCSHQTLRGLSLVLGHIFSGTPVAAMSTNEM